ncbi:hypothetical protein L6164_032123 [Bauhinia variegata]|uniref:Uncharacterized protein n=1 Tax=Bauhinia variegata TaxID=167791 RepID=A0ACB9KML1_BAUVA|nr:hypothetical protein L6164_032123 [Bauhinia variegata]
MGYGRNFVKCEDQPLDWIDRLTTKAASPSTDQELYVWPQKPPKFRESIEEYVAEARGVLNYLPEALAEGLPLEGHVFLKYFDPKDSEVNVRVNHYPPVEGPKLAHTPMVNAGDLLEIISNGLIKSPYDRVLTQNNVSRTPVVLFYNLPARARIGPIANDGREGLFATPSQD